MHGMLAPERKGTQHRIFWRFKSKVESKLRQLQTGSEASLVKQPAPGEGRWLSV